MAIHDDASTADQLDGGDEHQTNSVLLKATAKLLRPLVQILLRHGVSQAEFNELSKNVYCEVAEKDFQLPNRKQSTSRISVITGLTRKDVARIKLEREHKTPVKASRNRLATVVSAWVRDEKFHNKKGSPMALRLDGESPNFSELVQSYAGDVPVRPVLDELLRVGVVARNKSGAFKLLTRAYVPQRSEIDRLHYLGESSADLLSTINHNLNHPSNASRLQLSLAYDNLPAEIVPSFKDIGEKRATEMLSELDRWLAPHDAGDAALQKAEGRTRAGLGVYYFEEAFEDDE